MPAPFRIGREVVMRALRKHLCLQFPTDFFPIFRFNNIQAKEAVFTDSSFHGIYIP